MGFDFLFGDFPGVKGLPMVDFHPPGLDAFSGENNSLLRLRTTPADFGVRGVAGCFCCSGVLAVALLLLRSLTDGEDSVLAIIILLIVVDHDELT